MGRSATAEFVALQPEALSRMTVRTANRPGALEINLLGPLEVRLDGRPVDVPTFRLRALLARLATSAGRTVSVEALSEAVWGPRQPLNARRGIQTYMTRLRSHVGPKAIETTSTGYRLTTDPEDVDAGRFAALLASARRARGEPTERSLLHQALVLWRGTPFEGVQSRWLDEVEAPRLVESYLMAVERRIDLDIAAGRHRDLIDELTALTARYPLRESLWVRLLVVLDRCGRPADALSRYEVVRSRIADELGIDPGPELRQMYADLLAGRGLRLVDEPESLAQPDPADLGLAGLPSRGTTRDGRGGGEALQLKVAGIGRTSSLDPTDAMREIAYALDVLRQRMLDAIHGDGTVHIRYGTDTDLLITLNGRPTASPSREAGASRPPRVSGQDADASWLLPADSC